MRLGFTGTRKGMTEAQRCEVEHFLHDYGVTELHHGDCVGADAEAHALAQAMPPGLGIAITVHPPEDPKLRANCDGPRTTLIPKPYLERNRDIVDATEHLLATPGEEFQRLRSGTWATIRYASEQRKPITIITPKGDVIVY